jgi:hypothetical protein
MIEIWKAAGLCGEDIYSFFKECHGWYIAPIPAGPAGIIPFPFPTECTLPTDVPCEDLVNQIIDAYHHATAVTGAHSRICPPGERVEASGGCVIVLPNSNEVSHP